MSRAELFYLKIREKGQTVLLDFSLGVFVFFIVFAALSFFWINNIEERVLETQKSDMSLKASLAADLLVKSPGSPFNWEELEVGSVNFIGLAQSERRIREEKLLAFQNMNYNNAKQLLNISEFDFFFELQGEDNATAGLPVAANVDTVTVTRIVEYKGSDANAVFSLYRT